MREQFQSRDKSERSDGLGWMGRPRCGGFEFFLLLADSEGGRTGLFVNLQLISERVLSALAFLLVERMVCLTAESGWENE